MTREDMQEYIPDDEDTKHYTLSEAVELFKAVEQDNEDRS